MTNEQEIAVLKTQLDVLKAEVVKSRGEIASLTTTLALGFSRIIGKNEIAALEQRVSDLESLVRLIQEVVAERAEFEGGDL